MSKVIPFKKAPEIASVAQELAQAIIEDQVTECIVIYRVKPTKDNGKGRICRYWFGENSTIMCLGLAHHMCDVIAEWIYQENLIPDDEIIDDN